MTLKSEAYRQALFERRMSQSELARIITAGWFITKGIPVVAPILTVSPSTRENHKHRDNGDLVIPQGIVEVKYVAKNAFVDAQSYQATYKTLLIAKKEDFDLKSPPPVVYVFVSQDFRALATLNVAKTQPEWWIDDSQSDPERGITYNAYRTNVINATFHRLAA